MLYADRCCSPLDLVIMISLFKLYLIVIRRCINYFGRIQSEKNMVLEKHLKPPHATTTMAYRISIINLLLKYCYNLLIVLKYLGSKWLASDFKAKEQETDITKKEKAILSIAYNIGNLITSIFFCHIFMFFPSNTQY